MKKLGASPLGRRSARLFIYIHRVLILLTVILVGNQVTKNNALTKNYLEKSIIPITLSTNTNTTIRTLSRNDGCGRINNRNSSTWRNLQQSEVLDTTQVQVCLKRIGRFKHATALSKKVLNCSTPINFETIRSTLSRYDKVWLHGDSIMEQTFYTLACIMNFSISELPTEAELGGPNKMRWTVNLAQQGRLIEKFTFTHAQGQTEFRFSRYGIMWGLQDNLYKYDFPFAVQNLTSKDIILTTGASSHYAASQASQYEKALEFISSQSKLSNAPIYLLEPTPEEWPTSNGMYTQSCIFRCGCETLSEKRMTGHGKFTTRDEAKDKQYTMKLGKPETEFFKRLYPNMTELAYGNCIPNCLPNSWRTDIVRKWENDSGKVHLIPIYWQLASIQNGNTGRGHGDCTHRNLYATELMVSQWVRTILLDSSII